jgi:hypothetical protein
MLPLSSQFGSLKRLLHTLSPTQTHNTQHTHTHTHAHTHMRAHTHTPAHTYLRVQWLVARLNCTSLHNNLYEFTRILMTSRGLVPQYISWPPISMQPHLILSAS